MKRSLLGEGKRRVVALFRKKKGLFRINSLEGRSPERPSFHQGEFAINMTNDYRPFENFPVDRS